VRATILIAAVAVPLVAAVAAGPGAAAPAQARCTPTPQDGFGPFGSGEPPLRSKTGTGHVLTGVVIASVTCRPIPRARVEFWQSDRRGLYVPALSATVIADAQGHFRYESPQPVAEEGRPGHIHVRVDAENYEPLLTRYEPHGSHHGSLRLVLVPAAL
jgi:protocatechuate 3,4-dioxygenase beta subunit